MEIDEGDWSWPKTSIKSVRNNRFGGIARINRFSANVAYNFDQNTVLKARFQDFYRFRLYILMQHAYYKIHSCIRMKYNIYIYI